MLLKRLFLIICVCGSRVVMWWCRSGMLFELLVKKMVLMLFLVRFVLESRWVIVVLICFMSILVVRFNLI